MNDIQRVLMIVLDSVGCGEAPDADQYGDEGSNTLGNTARAVGGLDLPNLASLGLGQIIDIAGVPPCQTCRGSFGKMQEQSKGKDTTTGHWEMGGIILDQPFPTYPDGFPTQVIEAFERAIGSKVLGNKVASGTVIIEELGPEHMETGFPIVYTSADSVFQIAAHEEIISVDELYDMCLKARDILRGRHGVGRVIARPFLGKPGAFKRTERRRDFSLEPPGDTILDLMTATGHSVYAVGKIEDIFAHRGITESNHSHDNMETIDAILTFMDKTDSGLIFANCVDFDMLWGHRNDVQGYASGLEHVDARLPEILERMSPADILMIVADHGCDPTTPSTDHSREYVPLLVYGPSLKAGVDLGIRQTFADVAATLAEIFETDPPGAGTSFWSLIH